MHVNSAADAGLEPASATSARHGAQDPAADHGAFGALLLLLLPAPAVTLSPDGTAPSLGRQRPGSDGGAGDAAIMAVTPSIIAGFPAGDTATPGVDDPIAGSDASALARGTDGGGVALVGASSASIAPSPGAGPVLPTPLAADGQAATLSEPAAPRTASFTRVANPGSESRPRVVSPDGPVATPHVQRLEVSPDAVAGAVAAGGANAASVTNAAGDPDRAAQAATTGGAPPAPFPDAPGSRPEARPDPRSASVRRRERDVEPTPHVDDGARGQGVLAALTARPAPSREDADTLPRTPSTEHLRAERADPDATLIARATSAAARTDTPAAATGAAPTEAARAVAEPPVVEQIVRTARLVMRDGVTEMDVQLTPPSLGTVRVTAAAAGDGLGLTLAAERPETRALLLHAIPEMQAALAAQGIATTTIAVASGFEPPGERRAPGRREPERPSRPAREVITERPRASRAAPAVGALDLTV